jgi:hypothetical protein
MTAPRWTQADINYLADPHVQAIGRTIIASSGILHGPRPCQAELVWQRINRDWPGIDSAAMRVDAYGQETPVTGGGVAPMCGSHREQPLPTLTRDGYDSAVDIDGYVVDNRWQPGHGLAAALAVSIGFWTLLWWVVFG